MTKTYTAAYTKNPWINSSKQRDFKHITRHAIVLAFLFPSMCRIEKGHVNLKFRKGAKRLLSSYFIRKLDESLILSLLNVICNMLSTSEEYLCVSLWETNLENNKFKILFRFQRESTNFRRHPAQKKCVVHIVYITFLCVFAIWMRRFHSTVMWVVLLKGWFYIKLNRSNSIISTGRNFKLIYLNLCIVL